MCLDKLSFLENVVSQISQFKFTFLFLVIFSGTFATFRDLLGDTTSSKGCFFLFLAISTIGSATVISEVSSSSSSNKRSSSLELPKSTSASHCTEVELELSLN